MAVSKILKSAGLRKKSYGAEMIHESDVQLIMGNIQAKPGVHHNCSKGETSIAIFGNNIFFLFHLVIKELLEYEFLNDLSMFFLNFNFWPFSQIKFCVFD